MTRTVTLGALSAGVPAVVDAAGCEWHLTGIDGWDNSGSGVRRQSLPRPQQHGAFGERGFRTGRAVGLSGAVDCPTRTAAAAVVQALSALLADGTDGELVVEDVDQVTMTATVGLGDEPVVDWSHPTMVRFAFEFFAPDPLRYGDWYAATTTFPVRMGGLRFPLYSDGSGALVGALDYGEPSSTGRVEILNSGTADTWTQFNIAGPVAAEGFEIVTVGTNARIRFEGGVSTGSNLVIDSATGTAVIDGTADRGGLLTYRDWVPIPAGGSAEYAFIPLGSTSAAVLTASARPAFW